jgi:hypothetical protein
MYLKLIFLGFWRPHDMLYENKIADQHTFMFWLQALHFVVMKVDMSWLLTVVEQLFHHE